MVIDRFEGDYAVVETDDGDGIIDIHISELPSDAKEGDVLIASDNGYAVDREATEQRRAAAAARLKKLLGRG